MGLLWLSCALLHTALRCVVHGTVHGMVHGTVHGMVHAVVHGIMHGTVCCVVHGTVRGVVHGIMHGMVHHGASEIGALCHIFRDIDVIGAVFTELALLGATMRKALQTSKYSKIATSHQLLPPVLLSARSTTP